MKKIFVCSKLRGDINNNIKKAKEYCRNIALNKNIPIAPHIYFTLFLNELNENERNLGILMGIELLKDCDEVWVFNKDISEGMQKEINVAKKLNIKIIYKWK